MNSFEVLDFVHYLEDDGNEPGQVVAVIDGKYQVAWPDGDEDLYSYNELIRGEG